MIVDTSAIVAIAQREPGWRGIAELAAESECVMSAGSWLELGIVARQRGEAVAVQVDALLESLGVSIAPVTVEQARIARFAYARYGRGSGSPAQLNFGDCFAYALAVERRESLLFVGDDFSQTDVLAARSE